MEGVVAVGAFVDLPAVVVPDDVLARLKRLAVQEGLSVSAMAVRELAESTRRADNAALLGALPDLDVPASEVLAALDGARAEK